jgi:hypothetical protein
MQKRFIFAVTIAVAGLVGSGSVLAQDRTSPASHGQSAPGPDSALLFNSRQSTFPPWALLAQVTCQEGQKMCPGAAGGFSVCCSQSETCGLNGQNAYCK